MRRGCSVFATSAIEPTGMETIVPPFPSGVTASSASDATSLREFMTASISTTEDGISTVPRLSILLPPDARSSELVPMNSPPGSAMTDNPDVIMAAIMRRRRRAGIAVI
jgi:hypothetical protein